MAVGQETSDPNPEVRLLAAKVARLEAAVAKIVPPSPGAAAPPAPGGMMGGGAGGGMMGMMGGGAAMPPTLLPGFPGTSRLYHVWATDFFLDHVEHITLSAEQAARLTQFKQRAAADRADAQHKVEMAERQVWELTASDQPDAAKIEAKVREVEKLRGDQRLAFIRAVGEAAQVLTDEQRKAVVAIPPAEISPEEHAGHHPTGP
ncbi:MAG: Spy/CpxP family protein refolding chaperone [Gemmataceae bacterium]